MLKLSPLRIAAKVVDHIWSALGVYQTDAGPSQLFFLETPATSRAFRQRVVLNSEGNAHINGVPWEVGSTSPFPYLSSQSTPIAYGLHLPGLGWSDCPV